MIAGVPQMGRIHKMRNGTEVELKTVFDHLQYLGHCDEFEPEESIVGTGSNALPGSMDRIDEYAERVEQGQPIWHVDDVVDYQAMKSNGIALDTQFAPGVEVN